MHCWRKVFVYNFIVWLFACYFPSDLKLAREDLEVMKKQAESTSREYDRLAQENQTLQVRSKVVFFDTYIPP